MLLPFRQLRRHIPKGDPGWTSCAPIYLKTGGSVAKTHSWDSSVDDAKKRAKQVGLVKRMIDTYYPEAIGSKKGAIR